MLPTIPLQQFEPQESVDLIQRIAAHVSQDDAEIIAEILGHLPLALYLAGSYLGTYQEEPVAKYIAELQEVPLLEHESLQAEEDLISYTKHESSVLQTFILTTARFTEGNPSPIDRMALELLQRAAYFASGEPIPRPLLLRTLDQHPSLLTELTDRLPTPRSPQTQRGVGDDQKALRRLLNLGLLEGEQAVRLHRLLQAFVIQRFADPEAMTAVERTIAAHVALVNKDANVREISRIQNQATFVVDRAKGRVDRLAGELCTSHGYSLYLLGRHVQAEPYIRRSIAIRQQVYPPFWTKIGSSNYVLALCLQMQCRFEEARQHYTKALRIRRFWLGKYHINTISCYRELGYLLFLMGHYVKAEQIMHRVIQQQSTRRDQDVSIVRSSTRNLGFLYLRVGVYDKALEYAVSALHMSESTLTSSQIGIGQALNNIGEILFAKSGFGESKTIHLRALALREEVFSGDHTDIAESLLNLGKIAHMYAAYNEADDYFRRSLQMNETVLNGDHREIALTLCAYGAFLRDYGDYALAHKHLTRALDIQRKITSDLNFETLQTMNETGLLYCYQQQYDDAEKMLQHALSCYNALNARNHPQLATTYTGLGRVAMARGETSTARTAFDRAYSIGAHANGGRTIQAAVALSHLAELSVSHDRESGLEIHRRALACYESVVQDDHPAVIATRARIQELLAHVRG